MFKIPLFTGKSLGFDRDMVTFSIKYGNLPNFFCKAIIDTGCPFTIVSESSIKRTRIPYRDLWKTSFFLFSKKGFDAFSFGKVGYSKPSIIINLPSIMFNLVILIWIWEN